MKRKSQLTPENPEQLFATGYHHHQNGQLTEAIEVYQKLLEQFSDAPLILYNIGLAHQENNDYPEAISYYSRAAEISPGDADILYNLALCYQKVKNGKKALAFYQKAHKYSPDDVDIHYNMGCCQQQDNNETEAMASYKKVLSIDQDHTSALSNLAYLYQKKGLNNEAIVLYDRLISLQPDHQGAQHMLASLTGSQATDMPKQYVTEVFDHYSDRYEDSLVGELGYDVPNKLRRLYKSNFNHLQKPVVALDLGCGTGLSGMAFRDICASLIGIDLSSKMIAEAEKKQIYDQLVVADIIDFLKNGNNLHDLIIAADVLTYIGELEEILKLALTRSSKGGIFCFSTEKSEQQSFGLGQTGRFQHSTDYLRQAALQAGWQTTLQVDTDLRMEKGEWIPGNITFLVS